LKGKRIWSVPRAGKAIRTEIRQKNPRGFSGWPSSKRDEMLQVQATKWRGLVIAKHKPFFAVTVLPTVNTKGVASFPIPRRGRR